MDGIDQRGPSGERKNCKPGTNQTTNVDPNLSGKRKSKKWRGYIDRRLRLDRNKMVFLSIQEKTQNVSKIQKGKMRRRQFTKQQIGTLRECIVIGYNVCILHIPIIHSFYYTLSKNNK